MNTVRATHSTHEVCGAWPRPQRASSMAPGASERRGAGAAAFSSPLSAGGATATLNGAGFEMGAESPLLRACVDGALAVAREAGAAPLLLDCGCAYGLNARAALRELSAASARPPRVVAADMEVGHLEAVNKLGLAGIVTAHCKLPDELPTAEARDAGAILVADVLHFLEPAQVDASLAALAQLLAPGGVICATAMSPHSGPCAPGRCEAGERFTAEYRARKAAKVAWPGADLLAISDSLEQQLLAQGAPLEQAREVAARAPTSMTLVEPNDLAGAARRAGLEVVSAELCHHPGYPPFLANLEGPGDCTALVARRPKARD